MNIECPNLFNPSKFAAVLPFLVFVWLNAAAQRKSVTEPATHKMVQSVFYDANAMYWALRGYNACPVLLPATTTQTAPGTNQKDSLYKTKPTGTTVKPAVVKPKRNNAGPGGPFVPIGTFSLLPTEANGTSLTLQAPNTSGNATVNHYKVIELTTGKILMDNCTAADLNTVLRQHVFADTDRTDFINDILSRNAGDTIAAKYKTRSAIYQELLSVYQDNSYMRTFFSSAWTGTEGYTNIYQLPGATAGEATGGAGIAASVNTGTQGATGSMPTINTLVQGLVDFDIQAVNAEIDEAFFIHLQDVLKQYKELAILFPKTLQSLNKISVTSYTQSLAAIRSAYETDMKNLLGNISGLAALPQYKTAIEQYKALTLLFGACDMISMLQKGKSVPDILYAMSNAAYVTQISANDYNSAVRLAATFSNAFTDIKIGDKTPNSLTWVQPSMLDSLRSNDTASIDRFKIFMGLFAENCKGIKIGSFDFYGRLNSSAMNDILKNSYIIYNYATAFNSIKAEIDSANKATGAAVKAGIYIDLASQLLNLADQTLGVFESNQTTAARAKIDAINSRYLPLLKNADSVAYDVENKAYSTAIYAADTLVNNVLDSLKLFYKNTPKLAADTASINDIKNYFVKYGGFIAAIALSQNAADVKNAIQTFALPTGSSRIKKEHVFSWGLNSYVGVYHAWNTDYGKYNMPAQETGITAPVGIGLNWGHFGGGSISVYGGIIDIGAIFSYTASTNNQVQSTIKLGQILSPSLGLVYGFPIIKKYNIPVSIGANYQLGPELKNVDTNGNSLLSKQTGRFNLFLAIDIPMFNFGVSKD